MKAIFKLFIYLTIISASFAQNNLCNSHWQIASIKDYGVRLNKAVAISGAMRIAVGNAATALISSDDFKTYTRCKFPKEITRNIEFYDVAFEDANTGYIVGSCGVVLKTEDQGSSWKLIKTDTDLSIYSISNINQHYILCGENGMLALIKDSKINVIHSDFNFNLYSVEMLTQDRIIAVGDSNSVIKSTDGGASFVRWSYPVKNISYLALSAIDSNNIVIAGSLGYMLKTSNFGSNWKMIPRDSLPGDYYGDYADFRTLRFIDKNIGYAWGSMSGTAYTANGGTSWELIENGLIKSSQVFDSYINSNNEIVLLGEANYYMSSTVIKSGNNCKNFSPAIFHCNTGISMIAPDNYGDTVETLSGNSEYYIREMTFFNDNNAVAYGNSGQMIKTKDEGNSWTQTDLDKTSNIYDYTKNNLYEFLLLDNNKIIRINSNTNSIDSVSVVSDTVKSINSVGISLAPDTKLWSIYENLSWSVTEQEKGFVYYSNDNGNSWERQDFPGAYFDSYSDIVWHNDTGYVPVIRNSNDSIKNWNYMIYKTPDYGKTWEKIDLNIPKIDLICVSPKNKLLIYGNDGDSFVAELIGNSITKLYDKLDTLKKSFGHDRSNITVFDENYAVLITSIDELFTPPNKVYITKDGGATWEFQSDLYANEYNANYSGCTILDTNNIWIYGNRGIIFRYTGSSSPVSVNEFDFCKNAAGFIVSNGELKLFNAPTDLQSVELFSCYGDKILQTNSNGVDNNSITIKLPNNISNGVYFVKLNSINNQELLKIVVAE